MAPTAYLALAVNHERPKRPEAQLESFFHLQNPTQGEFLPTKDYHCTSFEPIKCTLLSNTFLWDLLKQKWLQMSSLDASLWVNNHCKFFPDTVLSLTRCFLLALKKQGINKPNPIQWSVVSRTLFFHQKSFWGLFDTVHHVCSHTLEWPLGYERSFV